MSKFVNLSETINFINERIETCKLSEENYISTENMIPQRGGVIKASNLPPAKTTLYYKKNDILISNIRLYFEKIWISNKAGGASSDILILRAKNGFNPKFIYYVLSDSNFFKYADVTSKGTKMPRGEKKAIEKYPIPNLDVESQEKIVDILTSYDELIKNNNRRIEILESAAEEIYKEWFIRMRFSGHKNTKLEKGIPKDWNVKRIKDLGEVITGKTPSTQVAKYYGTEIMFIKTPDMHGNVFTCRTENYLSDEGSKSQADKLIPKDSIMVSCIGTGGVVSINMDSAHTNQQINSIVLSDTRLREWAYFTLKSMKHMIELYGATGATMTNLSKGKFENLKIVLPKAEILDKFSYITKDMFDNIKTLTASNQNLIKQRDLLLPRLMNGTITVK